MQSSYKIKSIPGNSNKNNLAAVSKVEVVVSSTTLGKILKGKTSAEFRYYKNAKFRKLSKE